MAPRRDHAREELVECLWLGVAPAVARNRLRQALSSLRHVLEPPGAAYAPILQADRHVVRLVPGAVACDVLEFEASLRAGALDRAAAVY